MKSRTLFRLLSLLLLAVVMVDAGYVCVVWNLIPPIMPSKITSNGEILGWVSREYVATLYLLALGSLASAMSIACHLVSKWWTPSCVDWLALGGAYLLIGLICLSERVFLDYNIHGSRLQSRFSFLIPDLLPATVFVTVTGLYLCWRLWNWMVKEGK